MSIKDKLGFSFSKLDKELESIQKDADNFALRRVEMMAEMAHINTPTADNDFDITESYDVRLSIEQSKLEQLNLPYAELLCRAASNAASLHVFEVAYEGASEIGNGYKQIMNAQQLVIKELLFHLNSVSGMSAVQEAFSNAASVIEGKLEKYKITTRARAAANVRHSKPGGSKEKQEKIRQLWASGNFKSRDICAEQECAALGMSFSAARKALRNTPDPT